MHVLRFEGFIQLMQLKTWCSKKAKKKVYIYIYITHTKKLFLAFKAIKLHNDVRFLPMTATNDYIPIGKI